MESLDLVMRNGGSPAEICVRAGIVTEALVQAAAFPFGSHPCLRANASWHLASFSEMPPKDDACPVFQPASKACSMQWNRRRSINPA
jgi:hypothetical protein